MTLTSIRYIDLIQSKRTLKFYLFLCFWLCWVSVAVPGPPLVSASGGCSSLRHICFSSQWLLLWSSLTVGFSSHGAQAWLFNMYSPFSDKIVCSRLLLYLPLFLQETRFLLVPWFLLVRNELYKPGFQC